MRKESLENILFATTLNPMLKAVISRFDVECTKDGNLLLN